MNSSASFAWTDDDVARLSKWWRDGLSASRISALFGKDGPSRSAVIGKVHRLGIGRDGRATPSAPGAAVHASAPRAPRPAAAAPKAPKRGPLTPAPDLRVVHPLHEERSFQGPLKDLLELGAHDCKWPIGEVGKPGFGFCGQRAFAQAHIAGTPMYCRAHGKLAGDGVARKPVGPFYCNSVPAPHTRKAAGE